MILQRVTAFDGLTWATFNGVTVGSIFVGFDRTLAQPPPGNIWQLSTIGMTVDLSGVTAVKDAIDAITTVATLNGSPLGSFQLAYDGANLWQGAMSFPAPVTRFPGDSLVTRNLYHVAKNAGLAGTFVIVTTQYGQQRQSTFPE